MAQEPSEILDDPQHPLREGNFDPQAFEELRDCLGTARMRSALVELSSYLQESFPEVLANDLDRDQTFRKAHFLVARAGMMGFPALRDACFELQYACAKGAVFSAEHETTRKATITAREVIASLLQRPL